MCAHQQQYYDAITAISNAANSGPFIDFMLGEILKTLEAHKGNPIQVFPNKVPNKLLEAFPEIQAMTWNVYNMLRADNHLFSLTFREIDSANCL